MYFNLRFYFHSSLGQNQVTTSGSGYVCIIIVTSLSKMYCSQGDQRFRFLLNRFWAAPPFSKVCWLALLTSHYYRKLSKKQGTKLRFCLKSLEQKCLIQELMTKVEILCSHSCSTQIQAAGKPQAAELEWTFSASNGKKWALLSVSRESSLGINSTAEKLPLSVHMESKDS